MPPTFRREWENEPCWFLLIPKSLQREASFFVYEANWKQEKLETSLFGRWIYLLRPNCLPKLWHSVSVWTFHWRDVLNIQLQHQQAWRVALSVWEDSITMPVWMSNVYSGLSFRFHGEMKHHNLQHYLFLSTISDYMIAAGQLLR